MTPQSLKRGNELKPLIENAKENIDRWEKAFSFKENAQIDTNFTGTQYSYLPIKYIPFGVIKAVALEAFRNELATLQGEFDSL